MKINSFKELMNEISWSWQYPTYNLHYNEKEEYFYLNKLAITKTEVTYKTEIWELAPHIFEEMKEFYKFVESTKIE